MNNRLGALCLLAFVTGISADEPTWKEIEAGAQAGETSRLEAWARESGVQSWTAANILIAAGWYGDPGLVDRLLALGIPPGATNAYGVTPLLQLARNGQTGMVRHFLQRGARADVIAFCEETDCKGHTPIFWAVCKQDLEMARMLLEAGADPRVGEDASLQRADETGDVEMFHLLKQFGAQEKGATPRVPGEPEGTAAPFAALGVTELLPRNSNRDPAIEAKPAGRLSIIADDTNLGLAGLLTARLSTEPLLELVERQELDRILSEQRLTRQFAADAANYSRIAELVRADALLLINERQLAGTKVVESRLIRVNPGLVLDTVYSGSPVPDSAEWTERMANRITHLAGKVVRNDAIALSMASIRASVNSPENRGLDRTLTVLLSDRLAHQPHFVLLERASMQRLVLENTSPFWTGSYFVDGTLEPALDGSGNFSISIRFQPSGQGEPLSFTSVGQRANPAAAVDNLLAQINARLSGSPSPLRRNPDDEARWYMEEATWALAAEQPALALSAAEAAWALGWDTPEVARLRVLAALLMVRKPQDPGFPGFAASLEAAVHGLAVWREGLQTKALHGSSEDLRKWLELGLDMADGAVLAIIRIGSVTERIREAERLEQLRELLWTSLEDIAARAEVLSAETGLRNAASEKQATVVRLLFPETSRFLPAARTLLERTFTHNNVLTRARIRAGLIIHWSLGQVMVWTSRSHGGTVNLALPPGHEASHQLSAELRDALAPEDRFVSALLAIRSASLRREASTSDVDRLCAALFAMTGILAEGGEVFSAYWDRFDALNNLNGVSFFAIHRTTSPDGTRMWERHPPEHTEFRRQLFLRIAAVSKAPAADFSRLVRPDQYTPEQAAEVIAAQARLGGPRRIPPLVIRGAQAAGSGAAPGPEPAVPQAHSEGRGPLVVRRLWNPFDLGLRIVPEFKVCFETMITVENRIWFVGYTMDRGGQADQHVLFVVEPDSMRTEVILIPEGSTRSEARIGVTPTHFVFISHEFMAVRDRSTGRWATYKEIKAAHLDPAVVNDSLYMVVNEPPGNALIRFHLKTRTSEILASTRRRPAASPFDDPELWIRTVAATEADEILVGATKPQPPPARILQHIWSPATRTWRPMQTGSTASAPADKVVGRSQIGRVAMVGKRNGVVGLHFHRQDSPLNPIPVEFTASAGVSLPASRYGPQNIRPDHANSFPGGLLLVPRSGSGFWVLLQKEIDDYVQLNSASTTAQSAPN